MHIVFFLFIAFTGYVLSPRHLSQPTEVAFISVATGDSTCAADFAVIETAVRSDYPGFRDKTPGREAVFETLTDSVRTETANARDEAACMAAIERWIAFFEDNHLQAWDPRLIHPSETRDEPAVLHIYYSDDSTAVLRIPSFGQQEKPAIDSLLQVERARLSATPYLVIDLRGNGGGWTDAYERLLPIIYTGPIRREGMDVYASAGNIALFREITKNERYPEAIREQALVVLERMEANPGGFVLFSDDEEIRFDSVHTLPRTVAVIVDRGCASTCEQFVLDAEQSEKVIVFGSSNTRGMLDYGNAARVPLPSGERRFQMPRSRSHRLPERPLDATGIAPAVQIPSDEPDPIAFVRRLLISEQRNHR